MTARLIRSLAFNYFVSESINSTRIQLRHLSVGHMNPNKIQNTSDYTTKKKKKSEKQNHFADFFAMHSSQLCVYILTYMKY